MMINHWIFRGQTWYNDRVSRWKKWDELVKIFTSANLEHAVGRCTILWSKMVQISQKICKTTHGFHGFAMVSWLRYVESDDHQVPILLATLSDACTISSQSLAKMLGEK